MAGRGQHALGAPLFDGGPATAFIGVLTHIGVAFGWSAVFLVLAGQSARLRGVIATPGGIAAVAAIYGPLIWMTMSLAVIPALTLTHRPPTIAFRWWVQFFGHMIFVGLPIVGSIARTRTA